MSITDDLHIEGDKNYLHGSNQLAEGHRWSSSEDLHSDERSSSTELSVTNTGSEHDSSDTTDKTLSDTASSIDLHS